MGYGSKEIIEELKAWEPTPLYLEQIAPDGWSLSLVTGYERSHQESLRLHRGNGLLKQD